MAERDIQHQIREDLGLEPDLVLWRNGVGSGVLIPVHELQRLTGLLDACACGEAAGLLRNIAEAGRYAKYGLPKGSADLVGILKTLHYDGGHQRVNVVGRFFVLEIKRAAYTWPNGKVSKAGRTTPEQDQWLELVRRMGGFASVVRSVSEAKAALERARRGESK